MVKTYVLYHANCPDGHGAAWAAWKALGEAWVEYVPVQHGDAPPQMDDLSRIYILDFSYKREVLQGLFNGARELAVLDHHKSAQQDLEGLPFAHFNMHKSGAVMAWHSFHPAKTVPRLLEYVQDHDLWQYKLPYSREVRAWLNSYPRTFEVWDELAQELEERNDDVIVEGKACARLMRQSVEHMCGQVHFPVVAGVKMPVVNTAIYFSEVGEALLEKYPQYDVAAYYFDRADGKRHWGLRSREHFDCSEVAKRMGGGGHRCAAGFVEEKVAVEDV